MKLVGNAKKEGVQLTSKEANVIPTIVDKIFTDYPSRRVGAQDWSLNQPSLIDVIEDMLSTPGLAFSFFNLLVMLST